MPLRVTEHGLLGDRAYALIDVETGKVASAKTRGAGRTCLNFGRPTVRRRMMARRGERSALHCLTASR